MAISIKIKGDNGDCELKCFGYKFARIQSKPCIDMVDEEGNLLYTALTNRIRYINNLDKTPKEKLPVAIKDGKKTAVRVDGGVKGTDVYLVGEGIDSIWNFDEPQILLLDKEGKALLSNIPIREVKYIDYNFIPKEKIEKEVNKLIKK